MSFNEKIREKLEEIDPMVFYGRAGKLDETVLWNYIVFFRDKRTSSESRTSHTVAFHVAAQKKRSGVPMVVLSTASPFKFPRSVLEALGRTAPENDFEAMQQLEAATGHAAPASLAALRQKAERFDTVIDPAQIAEVALGYQA